MEEREKERKQRAEMHAQEHSFREGKGFGRPPKKESQPYVYVSAYNRYRYRCSRMVKIVVKKELFPPFSRPATNATKNEYYCKDCDRNFNGPVPFKLHMKSQGHREIVESLTLQE